MKIIIDQSPQKIIIEFHQKGLVDKYIIDKADDFLLAIDKFRKKRKIDFALFRGATLEIRQASILTERIIRAILQGISMKNVK